MSQFFALLLDVQNMPEMNKLNFLDGLEPWVQQELH